MKLRIANKSFFYSFTWHGWEENIKMDRKEIGWRLWIGFIFLGIRVAGSYENCNESSGLIKCGKILD